MPEPETSALAEPKPDPAWSRTWTWLDGAWAEGNVPIMGARTHAAWLGSSVFDGARMFEGVAPDLDRHAMRLNESAVALGLRPVRRWQEIVDIAWEGARRFSGAVPLYVKPIYWAEGDGPGMIIPAAETTRFCLALFEAPMVAPTGMSVTLTSFRRPTFEQAPVNAKAGCLYPNAARALKEAKLKGFDNGIVLDGLGHVAELATANIFMVRDGAVHTPAANGTFLNGITRQRVISLLRGAGIAVYERSLSYGDFLGADEIFSTGNYSKVLPVTQIDGRDKQPGPLFHRARELYWAFAHGDVIGDDAAVT